MLKINKKFAKKYDEYRRKEELQKFKDKYGDVKLGDSKSLASKSADANAQPGASSAESSESESSDSECRGWTPGTEAGFLRVYAALQSGDSRLLDPEVNWFQDEEENDDEGDEDAEEEKHRPMYYNEFHRKFLLEGAYKAGEDSASAGQEAALPDDAQLREGLREAERIRDSLARAHGANNAKAEANGGDTNSNGDADEDKDDFLVKRRRGDQQLNGSEDPMLRLHRFVAEAGDSGDGLEPDCKADLAKLKRHWTNERGLTEAERYLRDFITKEFWRQPQQRQQAAAEPDSDSDDDEAAGRLSEDEAFLARQSEFESRWNGRTDERDPEFESEFRRTFASGDQQLDDDDDDDEELFVAKKTSLSPPEPELDEDTAAELLQLEERRSQPPNQGADDDDNVDDEAAEEAGGEAGIRSYPRRIGDSLRQSTSDADRARRRAELRERRRAERLSRRREFDAAVRMKATELERRLERLRRNAGIGEAEAEGEDGGEDRVAETLGGDFLEEEFDPAEHDRRMARLFDADFYGEGDKANKPDFSEDEDESRGEESAEELRRRLQEEADRLGAEDLIRAGPGEADLACRFSYRQVEPNDFGLSAAEILLADDRELNAWCSVRKASQYREREADWRDRRRFRSARAQERKAQLMPGMMKRLEAVAAYPDAKAWAAAAAAGRDLAANEPGTPHQADQKKRRRKKKKKQQEIDGAAAAAAAREEAETVPRSRKKRRLMPPGEQQQPAAAEAAGPKEPEMKKQKIKKQQKKQKKKKPGSDSGLQISEQRLVELGIDPKRFRRLRKLQQQSSSSS